MEDPLLTIGGLASPGRDRLTSPRAVTAAKKMISRYCLLAWTMCFSTLSRPLRDQYGSVGQLLEKRLLTERELAVLKVGHLKLS